MNELPAQYAKRYSRVDFERVMYLFDYHPWDGGGNPRIDKITHTLLNVKNGAAEKRRLAAVNYFSKVLTTPPYGLSNLVDGVECLFAVVPSHSAGVTSPGLLSIIENIAGLFNFVNAENVLFRHTTVPKAATGGARSVQVHLDSISVVQSVADATIYLFDDVTTTGCSLEACKDILLRAGAKRVAMIALGQTYLGN